MKKLQEKLKILLLVSIDGSGSQPTLESLHTFRSIVSYYFLQELKKSAVELMVMSVAAVRKENLPTVDYVIIPNKNIRTNVIKSNLVPKLLSSGNLVFVHTLLPKNKLDGLTIEDSLPLLKSNHIFHFGIGSRENIKDLPRWGVEIIQESKNCFYIYPTVPKDYKRHPVKRGKVFIDNGQERKVFKGDRIHDLYLFHEVLEEMRATLDLDVWQETILTKAPKFVQPIASGNNVYVPQKGLTKAVMPWIQYRKHIDEAMIFMVAQPETYGIDKFNAIASGGQVIVRKNFEQRRYIEDFGFLTFNDKASLKQAILKAFDRFDNRKKELAMYAEKTWSFGKLINELLHKLETIKLARIK